MSEIRFDDEIHVELIQHSAHDGMVVNAARVSTQGLGVQEHEAAMLAGNTGGRQLINFLMKNRHGCYDSDTEVLTADGWIPWPEVTGKESFATLNLNTRAIEYQQAHHVIHKHIDGPMIRIKTLSVDLLVTPDHNMVAASRMNGGFSEYSLLPAKDFLLRSHRIPMVLGKWSEGSLHCPELAEIAGMIVADAHVGSSIEFNFKNNPDKAMWLKARYPNLSENDQRYRLLNPDANLMKWARDTYAPDGSRKFPTELLRAADTPTLVALMQGYIAGDGIISSSGKITFSSVSRNVIDGMQEISMKIGVAITEILPDVNRSSAYGDKILYRGTIYRKRNSYPRIGWTRQSRKKEVTIQSYSGDIHCVTVPNGTLYVRRNGKAAWCGNTPFEHNLFTWRVCVPIFCMREVHRHRIASYNEQSGRYMELEPHFYRPSKDRPLTQVGKPGHYTFVVGNLEQFAIMSESVERANRACWDEYQTMLAAGIAKEVARIVLPLNTYSSCYVTCNARSLMNFLSLRTIDQASMFPSFPMHEIEKMATEMEKDFTRMMPVTHAAFHDNGRVAP